MALYAIWEMTFSSLGVTVKVRSDVNNPRITLRSAKFSLLPKTGRSFLGSRGHCIKRGFFFTDMMTKSFQPSQILRIIYSVIFVRTFLKIASHPKKAKK